MRVARVPVKDADSLVRGLCLPGSLQWGLAAAIPTVSSRRNDQAFAADPVVVDWVSRIEFGGTLKRLHGLRGIRRRTTPTLMDRAWTKGHNDERMAQQGWR